MRCTITIFNGGVDYWLWDPNLSIKYIFSIMCLHHLASNPISHRTLYAQSIVRLSTPIYLNLIPCLRWDKISIGLVLSSCDSLTLCSMSWLLYPLMICYKSVNFCLWHPIIYVHPKLYRFRCPIQSGLLLDSKKHIE